MVLLMKAIGVQHCGIADTVGIATPRQVSAHVREVRTAVNGALAAFVTPTLSPPPLRPPQPCEVRWYTLRCALLACRSMRKEPH